MRIRRGTTLRRGNDIYRLFISEPNKCLIAEVESGNRWVDAFVVDWGNDSSIEHVILCDHLKTSYGGLDGWEIETDDGFKPLRYVLDKKENKVKMNIID